MFKKSREIRSPINKFLTNLSNLFGTPCIYKYIGSEEERTRQTEIVREIGFKHEHDISIL